MKTKKLWLFILLILFFADLSAALITHLKFEDNFEDSYGDINGNNGPIWKDENEIWHYQDASFTTGVEGKGIYFDGDDYIDLGNANYIKHGDFDPRGADNSYSISMWVYSTEQATSSNANSYIGKHNSTGGTNIFLFGYWNNQLSVRVRGNVQYISAAGSEPVNKWVHYVVTAKESGTSTAAKVYKNGAQIWSGTITDVMGTYSVDDLPWVLGQDWDSGPVGSDYFKGKMDNIRFYDTEIDVSYVRQIYLKESSYVHLTFDDNYEDSGQYSYNGWQSGSAVFKMGMENRAVSLDGSDDYVEFGTTATDPRLTNGVYKDFSISLWVKSNSSANSTNNNCYIGKHLASNNDNIFLFGYWGGALKIQIKNQVATVTTVAEPTTWTHYVIAGYEYSTNNTTTMKVYKNGEQIWEGTLNDTMGSFSSTNPWVLGQDWDGSGPSDFFYGMIDNVRFYKKILNVDSVDEVEQLYVSEFSGLRYCNTGMYASAACTFSTETDLDLSAKEWWYFDGLILRQVPHTSIESIKVAEGWEAYLCPSTNNQGTCHYFDDGVYASGGELPSALVNSTYSITVQPRTFDYAKKYFGYKKVGTSGNLPVGFAYFYQYANYAKPTKANDYRRLFMDSENRRDFQNMSNTILGAYRASGAELFGNVYAILSDNAYNDKYLMTSHSDFSFDPAPYSALDFINYNDDVKQIWLVGRSQEVGSVGWFIANDVNDPGERDYVCLNGVNETINENETRIECHRYSYNNIAFESGIGANEFFERVYSGNQQKFEKYADNYSLLMLTGHGFYFNNYTVPTNPSYYKDKEIGLGIPYWPSDWDEDKIIFFTESDYNNRLGKSSTKWVEITGCNTMGNDSVQNWSDVGDVYYGALNRLNGIGGYRNTSTWGCVWQGYDWGCETYNYYEHWNDLAKSTKTISKAWVDSWSESSIFPWWDRDARFLTLENCNCTQTTSCNSYMLNDYFFNVQTGPMDQKTTLTGYNYYCFRDRGDVNLSNYVRSLNKSMPEETYPEEFSSYSIEPIDDSIIEEMMGIKIGEKGTRAKEKNGYSYKDDFIIIKKSGKDFSAIMNRSQESFRYDNDWEYEAKDKFEEAKTIAETLTTLDLEYAGISKDTNEAFEIGGSGESLGKSVNSIRFVFRPKIDGHSVFLEDISVEYDAEGIYQIRSRVPYAISLSRSGKIMSEKQAVEELSKSVKMEEVAESKVMYVLNERTAELVLASVAKSEEMETFIIVPLEAKDE